MKRIILFIFIITMAAGFAACNVDESPQMETSKYSNATLAELRKYNNSLYDTTNIAIATRGKNNRPDRWDRILSISCYDIAGAAYGIRCGQIIGGGIGLATGGAGYVVTNVVCGSIFGAAASYKSWRHFKGYSKISMPGTNQPLFATAHNAFVEAYDGMKLDTTSYTYNTYIKYINLPSQYLNIRDIGECHNIIILKTLKNQEIKGSRVGPTTPPVIKKPDVNIPSLPPMPSSVQIDIKKIFDSNDFSNLYNEESAKDISEDINTYLDQNITSNNVKEALKLYFSIYKEFPNKTEDIIPMINNYIKTIESHSDFTDEDKKEIYTALIVSLYSPQLWDSIEESK